ncbi:MAG TPA: hypothetical protein VMT20_21155, partial [Terriglobia bacterium]|nr:hypothetical protein [Terriglobia bacterium]
LKRSGMFWTVRGANAIVALRCCCLNGRFEDYWESAGQPDFHFYVAHAIFGCCPNLTWERGRPARPSSCTAKAV